ncbi:enoyl-CoA hydratase/isomerase family protein [Priestia abyssalis]|uniref:enoyl-CoA hydratase/isomerase family protein n=1 Tax=Priestia abyssalis TaxID=1221450 RepID=UPI0009959BFF|nr:enoyl-CoA hydratase/isomerase family protein [Priestia abyssalis]
MAKTSFTVHEEGLAVFKILRPECRNAIDYDVMENLRAALMKVKEDSRIKLFMITGEGNQAFCSGGDLKAFHELKTEKEAYEMLSTMGTLLYELLILPKPTVALLNGTAIGGGCEVAIACDIRLAAEHSKLGFVQGNLGITTGWGGGSILMEKILPQDALFMLYTAKLFTAEEAKRLNYVQAVFSDEHLMERAENYCLDILRKPSNVLVSYKQAMLEKWELMNMKERMEKEIRRCAILWESEEHHEAVEAFKSRKS